MATTTTNTVTQEQIDACTRVIDLTVNRVFYQVRSERNPLVEYKVQYQKDPARPGKGYFTCTCPAGLEGFIHCSQGTCKHVRWALAAEQVYKVEVKARAAKGRRDVVITVNGKIADDETYNRVMTAKPYQHTEAEIKRDQERYQSRPFSFLK